MRTWLGLFAALRLVVCKLWQGLQREDNRPVDLSFPVILVERLLNPEITGWISLNSTLQLLQPVGPLSAEAAAEPLSAGDFWLVGGTIENGAVAFAPLMQQALDGPAGAGAGTRRIEVRDAGESALFTRSFNLDHGHGAPSPGDPAPETDESFFELVPVQAGAAAIVVLEGPAELGRITLGGISPAVTVELPASFTGIQPLGWTTIDVDSAAHSSRVDYSVDGGATWTNLAISLSQPGLAVDFDALPGGENAVFRIIVSDGVNSGSARSTPFAVPKKLPHAEIIAPTKTSLRTGDLAWFQAAAWDWDDGTLDGLSVAWTSSLDGPLGSGTNLPYYALSPGTHTITLSATDSDNNGASDTVQVIVTGGPLLEGQRTWIDTTCSGALDGSDALALLVHLAGLPGNPGCDTIGDLLAVDGTSRPWGDADCDGAITLPDVMAIRRQLAGLALTLPQGCPAPGATVIAVPFSQ